MIKTPIAVFWFRRDLRLQDNAALFLALKSEFPVLPIFIFDRDILDKLENKKDARVLFIHQEVSRLKNELEKIGSSLQVFYGKPQEIYRQILNQYQVKALYANRDYEPYAHERDKHIYSLLGEKGIQTVLIGGKAKGDIDAAQAVISNCTQPTINLLGKTNIKQLISLISLSNAHIGGDTGSTHIAAALGTPAVGLYSITKPIRSCPYGQIDKCHYSPISLAEIQPTDVYTTVLECLK